MGRKTYTAEQIINKLREAEVLLSQGATFGEASKKIGVTEQPHSLPIHQRTPLGTWLPDSLEGADFHHQFS